VATGPVAKNRYAPNGNHMATFLGADQVIPRGSQRACGGVPDGLDPRAKPWIIDPYTDRAEACRANNGAELFSVSPGKRSPDSQGDIRNSRGARERRPRRAATDSARFGAQTLRTRWPVGTKTRRMSRSAAGLFGRN